MGNAGLRPRQGRVGRCQMTANTCEVLEILGELDEFLQRYRVKYAPVISAIRGRVAKVSTRDLPTRERNAVRELFGGMGSLDDVFISKLNGHPVDDEVRANEELERLTN